MIAPADPSRRAAYALSREVTRVHAKSFYFASHVLPRERRDAAYAVYAFCRSADDAVDCAPSVDDARRQIAAVHARLDRVFADQGIEVQTDLALADVARRFQLERAPFGALLAGMEIDLNPVSFRTFTELEDYCFKAAGVVGHMLLPVLGAQGPEARARAADLGIAMQLTNILRDVGEDLDRGRIYLPAEELAAFGLSHDDVRERRTGPAWSRFMEAQVARARAYYARADRGVPLIETYGGRLCTRVMRAVYGDILHQIERRGFDVFSGRARTSSGRKLALLGYAVAGRLPPSARALTPISQPSGALLLGAVDR